MLLVGSGSELFHTQMNPANGGAARGKCGKRLRRFPQDE
jgi:hypothetical protein